MRSLVHFVAALFVASILMSVSGSPADAGESGRLQLKVASCASGAWMSGVPVSVSIVRGSTEVDSDSGTTDSVGHVSFQFSDLEDGDVALVTLSPNNASQDSDHEYGWVGSTEAQGYFSLGIGSEDACDDSWYDEPSIIRCVYH